ncbi:GldG family protein [Gemmatimonadota bacterium]
MSEHIRADVVERARRIRWINLSLVAGILVLANVLGADLFFRWDLTGRGIYSLGSASRQVVRGLEDRLTIKAYFSAEMPAQMASLKRFIKDKLGDYKAYGRGMVHFEFVDPANEEALQQEAASYGIQPVAVQVMERDKVEARLVYAALVFLYEGRNETLPFISRQSGLEYDITTAIRRVSRTELPVVGFLSGHGMPTPETDLSVWTEELKRHYQVQTVTLDTFGLVPPEVEVLFLTGPTSGFDRWERYAIDQFIMRGGRTAWLLDIVDADLQRSQQGMAEPMPLGMRNWLGHYGIYPRTALVMDQRNNAIMITQRQGLFQVRSQVPYPFFPIAAAFDRENPVVENIGNLPLFYASPLDTVLVEPAAERPTEMAAVPDTLHPRPSGLGGLRFEPLVLSSERSSLQENFFFVQPNPQMAQMPLEGGPYVLAATLAGDFRSAFTERPAVPDTVDLPPLVAGPTQNRLIVVGDATFARNDYLSEGGVRFLLNTVDYLFQEEALIEIRSKEVDFRPLAEVGNATRTIVKWLNILLPPGLAIILGLGWWRYRRRRAQSLLAGYQGGEE